MELLDLILTIECLEWSHPNAAVVRSIISKLNQMKVAHPFTWFPSVKIGSEDILNYLIYPLSFAHRFQDDRLC